MVEYIEGNMYALAMREGAVPPGSRATSRAAGTRRNLGDLTWSKSPVLGFGPRPPNGGRGTCEESDSCIEPVEETVEGRRLIGGKERRDTCSGHRARNSTSTKLRAYGSKPEGFRIRGQDHG